MRLNISAKTFFFIAIFGSIYFLYLWMRNVNITFEENIYSFMRTTVSEQPVDVNQKLYTANVIPKTTLKSNLDMKYILQWTSPRGVPFVYMGLGQSGYFERNCIYTNCYVTADRSYLGDVTKFDVIAFAGPEVVRMSKASLPATRSPHQKYAFATIESADNYPICSDRLDNFFNWTWTYKTDSTARWGYMAIRDSQNNLIGPNTEMHWMKLAEMDPVSEEFKDKLKTKTKAAAWFVSNCRTRSGREHFVRDLQEKLKKYNLNVDIYGACGNMKCSRENEEKCNELLQAEYYFYLSFENSFSPDYVTEKIIYPLTHNTVPIVFGAANYTRFMPDGIYLNARELGAEKLADKMNELILNPDLYAEYFRWKNHYSYHLRHESVETDDYCRFCSMLNEDNLVKQISTYPNFRTWWDPPNRC